MVWVGIAIANENEQPEFEICEGKKQKDTFDWGISEQSQNNFSPVKSHPS